MSARLPLTGMAEEDMLPCRRALTTPLTRQGQGASQQRAAGGRQSSGAAMLAADSSR